jgi:DNA transformation protein
MTVSESYKEYAVDQLGKLGFVTLKKMFGCAGIYYDGLIFGLLADDVLYFKVDDCNRSDL